MIGALCTHLVHAEFLRLIPPLVLGALAFWSAPRPRSRREQTRDDAAVEEPSAQRLDGGRVAESSLLRTTRQSGWLSPYHTVESSYAASASVC